MTPMAEEIIGTSTVTIERIADAVSARMAANPYPCKQEGRISVNESRIKGNEVDLSELKSMVKDVAQSAQAANDAVLKLTGRIEVSEAQDEVRTLKLEKKTLLGFGVLSLAGGTGGAAVFKLIAKLFTTGV
jgi:hypothetical protein